MFFDPLHHLENRHPGVVVVHHVALGSLDDELLVGWHELPSCLLDNVPLGGVGKRNPETLLEVLETVEGQAAAVTQQRDHCRGLGVVLLFA